MWNTKENNGVAEKENTKKKGQLRLQIGIRNKEIIEKKNVEMKEKKRSW